MWSSLPDPIKLAFGGGQGGVIKGGDKRAWEELEGQLGE
jgi:hypothetical protein